MPHARRVTQTTGDLLRLLSDGRPRSRGLLVEETGLPRSAVSARLDELTAAGWLVRSEDLPSSGGRPASRIAFNSSSRGIAAIDLGASHATIAITDLDGDVLAERRESIRIADGPEAVLGHALDVVDELGAGLHDVRVAGVGIGVPGPVEHASGRPVKPPIMPGWDRFDIPAFLRDRIPVPALVDNDVNLLALGEHARRYPEIDDLIFVKVSTGIGAGIISGGSLQRGALGAAGDLGHVQVPSEHGEADLESIASGAAIAARLGAASTSAFVARLRTGDGDAVAATRAAGRDIGEVLATCVNLLNPSVIVIGGSIAEAGQEVLAGVREVVYRRSLPLATQALDIVQASGDPAGGVRGAALMVRRHLFAPGNIDVLLAGA
ncbi:ROK family transcriptional regulator [Microbacteriaceae bacterium VKM Ac-2855]|nr:ROK family transcriptional regulator [Microbacteriaceae bacterium VKM Ac-2855]